MEMIGKISRGSKMDQIYIPKMREGFSTGEYVIIQPLERKVFQGVRNFRPYFYNLQNIEPIKLKIIEEIFILIEKKIAIENIIITGSFLDKGFKFNDIDVLLINGKKLKTDNLKNQIERLTGIKTHIILLSNKTLNYGISTDPVYNLMISKCISKKRLIFKIKREINYKILDLALLKSKTLIDNFNILNGGEKYYLTFNMVAIILFIEGKKLSKDLVNREIERIFEIKIDELKENLVKGNFIDKYKSIYKKTFDLIMRGVR